MKISGIIVRTLPANIAKVKELLLALPGIEIPVEHDDGRMVVIIDETGQKRSGEALMKIQNFEGVLSANLVYQHNEEDNPQDDKFISDGSENLNNVTPKT